MAANRIALRVVKCLVFLMVLSLCSLCFGEAGSLHLLSVRVVNKKTGEPLPNQPVVVQLLYGNTGEAPENRNRVLHLETGSTGEARFVLPDAKPESLHVQVNLTDHKWRCSCQTFLTMESVSREGVVQARLTRSSKSAAPLRPVPGQIVFVASPPNLLERVFY